MENNIWWLDSRSWWHFITVVRVVWWHVVALLRSMSLLNGIRNGGPSLNATVLLLVAAASPCNV